MKTQEKPTIKPATKKELRDRIYDLSMELAKSRIYIQGRAVIIDDLKSRALRVQDAHIVFASGVAAQIKELEAMITKQAATIEGLKFEVGMKESELAVAETSARSAWAEVARLKRPWWKRAWAKFVKGNQDPGCVQEGRMKKGFHNIRPLGPKPAGDPSSLDVLRGAQLMRPDYSRRSGEVEIP